MPSVMDRQAEGSPECHGLLAVLSAAFAESKPSLQMGGQPQALMRSLVFGPYVFSTCPNLWGSECIFSGADTPTTGQTSAST